MSRRYIIDLDDNPDTKFPFDVMLEEGWWIFARRTFVGYFRTFEEAEQFVRRRIAMGLPQVYEVPR